MPDPAAAVPDAALMHNIRRYALILLCAALLLAAWGIIGRVLALAALQRQAAANTVLSVVTVEPQRSGAAEELVLPGTVRAQSEAPIYARTSGYLKFWYTDIGTAVRKGQLLAEIETPEIDQQLTQALADLATANANLALADSTNRRWQRLLKTQAVSKQDADQKAGDAAAKEAAAQSAAANVARLRDLASFKRVVAPFDGIVTARSTDVGALINAGQASGTELFHVADIRRLRIYVDVPEAYAAEIKPGVPADLVFAEHVGKTYPAVTARTANALDPVLRTLRVELRLNNTDNAILPGAYTEVRFKLSRRAATLRLPANTLIFRSEGLQVATVGRDRRIKLKSIQQGRDFGDTVEVLSGIDADDAVILNPPDSIVDGTPVRIAPAAPAAAEPTS